MDQLNNGMGPAHDEAAGQFADLGLGVPGVAPQQDNDRMARVAALQAQQEQTQAELNRLLAIERGHAIERCRKEIVAFGLTAVELGLQGAKSPVRYRSRDGKTWTGLGRKPTWVCELLAKGGRLADFDVGGHGETSA